MPDNEPSAEALTPLIDNFYMDGEIQEWMAVRLQDAAKADRDAAYRRGIAGGWSEAKRAAENAVIESPMSDPDRRMLRQKIRALAPPPEEL